MNIFRPKELALVIELLSRHVVEIFKAEGAESRNTMLARTVLDRAKDYQDRIHNPNGMGKPSQVVRQIEARQRVLNMIKRGLDGGASMNSWGSGEYDAYKTLAAGMGFTMITRTGAEKRGYSLKRTAKPIAFAYFPAPIQQSHPIYLLETHFKPKVKDETQDG